MYDKIIIKGAREHNLKNIDIEIPKNKIVVITGVSGSGKSTLAFDTIYADGQRRYVESLSAYARQFLGMMKKPDVDSIEGLSPAISIEQKTTSKNPRSTVGTITEVYDYLRLLYARIGTPYCPEHNIKIESMSPQKISENIIKDFNNKEIIILAPIIEQKKGTYEKLIEEINKEGYSRVRVNNKIIRSDEKIELERYKKHDIEIVMDRIKIQKDNKENISRLNEAIENANKKSKTGLIKILILEKDKEEEKIYSTKMACPICGLAYEELQPRMFSFNSPFGACENCSGLGIKMEFDEDLIIPNKTIGILDGAIKVYRNVMDGWRTQHLLNVAKANGFDGFTPINKLNKKQYDALMYGSNQTIDFTVKKSDGSGAWEHKGTWEGVIPQLERLYKQTESDYRRKELSKFMKILPCNVCNGKRLKKKILSIRIKNKNIIELTDLSIREAVSFFKNLKLNKKEEEIAKHILKKINYRLEFLEKVGLNYLTLSRSSGTLSGGEAQRIRLATNLGTNLTGVLYVLDEPSIGLHQRDNQKLIDTLKKLRDLGNTLIVIEHDEDTIRQADYVIDIGPGAGIHGGEIVAQGTPSQIEKNKESLTGKYLSGVHEIKTPKVRREYKDYIELKGANQNNLQNIDVKIPIGILSIITGVSGSGKSTLINETLYKEAMNKIYKSKFISGKHKSLDLNNIDKVIAIDQSPIGRTPRSNPATYTKLFDEIRVVFANTLEAKTRGYKSGRFSFNVKEGRCQACNGDGQIKIEMNFLPDVYVDCEECNGTRYNNETLEVKYKDKNIAQVLDMSVEEAYHFFENIPKIRRKLQTLMDVGLSYIKLGQSSVTLSGGEAQRIKITRELSKIGSGRTLYILDEPTTGLHFHDVNKLIEVLNRLVDKGNTVVVIEHNLDVIKCADYIIDLGPEGGKGGGQIIAQGTPEEIAKNKDSFTGLYLKDYLKSEKNTK